MKKKIALCIITILLSIPQMTIYAATAYQKEVTVVINEVTTEVLVYNVNDYNYFRLRDLCALVDFDIQWDAETEAVQVDTTKDYDILQGGGGVPSIERVNVDIVETVVYVNGIDNRLKAVNVGGYNYMQLRDFADLTKQSAEKEVNTGKPYITVDWNNATNAISITTMDNMAGDNNIETPVINELPKENEVDESDTDYEKQRSEWEQEVIEMVNEERIVSGLSEVTIDDKLMELARWRAEEMYEYQNAQHLSPELNLAHTALAKYFGINCIYAGENTHAFFGGVVYPSGVMISWLNSEAHKAHILNSEVTSIGIGYHNGCWSLWLMY